ncbi:hypothetical protein HHK36_019335 [Tetracentron sinense]|uniref:FeS cluster biogenesis domain-containing protein n=1 Tax=Tetracentron sinense TaxID=13715 RepID=A0A835DCN8_TETSI|nr:hypothetical protein HHK36_019335 [Tetracentron sinense]
MELPQEPSLISFVDGHLVRSGTDEKGKFDELIEDKGVKILIDPKALMHVIGTKMDFVDDKLRSEFIFINPNSKGQCGCGESFMTTSNAGAAKPDDWRWNVDALSLSYCIALQKLEMLVLAHNSSTGVEPSYQRFPCLKSLSMSHFSISALDLRLLLTAFPKIEVLALVNPEISMSDAQTTMKLRSPTLKNIYVKAISFDKFMLEADTLKSLHLKDSHPRAYWQGNLETYQDG